MKTSSYKVVSYILINEFNKLFLKSLCTPAWLYNCCKNRDKATDYVQTSQSAKNAIRQITRNSIYLIESGDFL